MTLRQTPEHLEAPLAGAGSARPAHAPGAHRAGTATHFRCGHERSPENTYGTGGRSRCRTCCRRISAEWRLKNPDRRAQILAKYQPRKLRLDRRYRRSHQLAFQLYFHLRRLMMRDGCWPGRDEKAERSAA